MLFVKHLQRSK